jgi:electron transfer flavoprotein beta subunit
LRVLVCVKRVPAPGARIVLTDDQQAVDARHLPFTVSPHEECAVEEAVRIKEQHDGSVVVMTLGPAEAEEQLRYAVSVGADEAVLLSTDGSDWDPQATAAAIAQRIAELEETGGRFDLILFGNESADSAGYQVGIRVAHALDRPVISGIKGLEIEDGTVVARRETGAGFEVYRLPLPAVLAVKEGINLPRYPTLPSRLKAKKVEVVTTEPEPVAGGLKMLRLVTPPEAASATTILGHGPEAAPVVADLFEKLGLL